MAQARSFSKIQIEIILDVSHLDLAPSMAIMFLVHS
jgi:hypothetical protein